MPGPPMAELLTVAGLTAGYGSTTVLRDVSLAVPAGGIIALLGRNGVGKTTLLRTIAGFIAPMAGHVLLDGEKLVGIPPHRVARRAVCYVAQEKALFADMTVGENLAVAVAVASGLTWSMIRPLSGRSALHARVREVAEAVGVADVLATPVAVLGYGTQRQLEIGVALAGRPRVVLLDEPTAGMSPGETDRICALIAGLPRDLTLLIVEHDMDVIRRLVDEITVLDGGAVLARGTPAAIQASALVQARYLGGVAE